MESIAARSFSAIPTSLGIAYCNFNGFSELIPVFIGNSSDAVTGNLPTDEIPPKISCAESSSDTFEF